MTARRPVPVRLRALSLRTAVARLRAEIPDAAPIGAGNVKTRSIGTYSGRATCPTTCPLVGVCYGEAIDRHGTWRRADERADTVTATWAAAVRTVGLTGRPVRLGVTGDWVDASGSVDHARVHAVYDAAIAVGGSSRKLVAWGYTHTAVASDAPWLQLLRSAGVVIRRSDVHAPDGAVVLDPSEPIPSTVTVCPVQTGRVASCADCLLCGRVTARPIGFFAHGRSGAVLRALRKAYNGRTWSDRR